MFPFSRPDTGIRTAERSDIIQDGSLLAYRTHILLRTSRPGVHRGSIAGNTGLMRDHVPFTRQPETRRIDLRATVRDPFGEIHVRRFQPRSALNVYALADLSGSMAFTGHASKYSLMRSICIAIARSAYRYGDAFGMMGANATIQEAFTLRASHRPGLEALVDEKFRSFQPGGVSVDGLLQAVALLGSTPKLVFLLSDFYFPLEQLEKLLASLIRHDVVPIVIGDSAENSDMPNWGLMRLQDLESGSMRLLFMRPSLRKKLMHEAKERGERLRSLFLRHQRTPVFVADRLDIDTLSRQLMEA